TASYDDALTVCAAGLTVKGIDVSDWQGTINWDAATATGIGYAIARINDGNHTDSQFTRNWAQIKSHGLVRGAYQFFEPSMDAASQADIVVNAVGLLGPGDLPV